MKTRINKILSVLAVVALVATSFVWAMPVAASTPGDGTFTVQDIPSATSKVLIGAGSSIVDIAVGADGKTVYVANALAGSYILKSTDAGQSFDAVQNNYAGVAPVAISVAPDDVTTIAVVDTVGGVYISKDGGTTWSALPAPLAGPYIGATVTDIAVAPARSGTLLGREYIVSLADPAAAAVNRGDVLIIGTGASWAPVIQEGVQAVGTLVATGAAGTYSLNYINQAGAAKVSVNFVIPLGFVAPATVAIVLAAGDTCGKVTGVNVVAPAGIADTFNIRGTTTAFIFANITNGATGASTLNGRADYTQVVFTPNFLGDRSVVVVGTGAGAGLTVAQIVNTATNTLIQTAAINVIALSNTADVGAVANGIVSSSIALPTNFDPTTSSGRRFYIGIASASTVDNDVYRIDDNSVRALGAVGGAAQLKSVAYNGTTDTGILFMGQVANSDVKYTTGMTSTSPTWTTTLKGPTGAPGAENVILRVASDYATTSRIFAGTSGVESALSVSNDAGISFVQESLINNGGLGNPSLSFSSDAKSVLLTEKDGNNYITIWQSEVPFTSTSWKRIFAKLLTDITNSGSLKTSGSAIYYFESTTVAVPTTNDPIYVSQDGGVSFATRNGPTGVGYKGATLRDTQTAYFCDMAGNVYKSTNGAWTWSTAVPGGVGAVNSISTGGANEILIAGTTVALSSDDAATFTTINSGLPAGTTYTLAKDTAYTTNKLIYTVDTTIATPSIYRVSTSSTSNTWENMGTPTGLGANRILGITTRSGLLYATSNNAGVGVCRTLTPTALVGNQNWQTVFSGLPGALAAGVGTTVGINLYGRVGAAIYAFNDYLATAKPTLTTPDDNYANAVNPSGGNGYPVDLKWKPMGIGSGQVSAVNIELVDKANGFTGDGNNGNAAFAISPTNPVISTNNAFFGGAGFVLQPNKTYLWRVRACATTNGQAIDSPWSDSRTINIQSGSIVSQQYAGPVLLGPAGGAQNLDPNLVGFSWAPVSGATEYTVIVSTDPALTKTVAGTPAKVTVPAYQATGLTNDTTYFWAVQATKPTTSVQTVGTFRTMPKPVAAPTAPVAPVQPTIVVQAPVAETPAYIWAVIAIGAILVIAVIILIVRTRRVP